MIHGLHGLVTSFDYIKLYFFQNKKLNYIKLNITKCDNIYDTIDFFNAMCEMLNRCFEMILDCLLAKKPYCSRPKHLISETRRRRSQYTRRM